MFDAIYVSTKMNFFSSELIEWFYQFEWKIWTYWYLGVISKNDRWDWSKFDGNWKAVFATSFIKISLKVHGNLTFNGFDEVNNGSNIGF